VIDVDEYLYGIHKPLKDVITDLSDQYDYLEFKMTIYGSSGFDKHPGNVRDHFVYRFPNEAIWLPCNDKAIFKTNCVNQIIEIHHHYHNGTFQNKFSVPKYLIEFNHYVVMSWEYFEKVKMSRGDATFTNSTLRDRSYFDGVNEKATELDTTLRDIARYGY
jgi:hypothetical protein